VEYAANDFEVALLAKGLGKTADYNKYLQRSANWKNLGMPICPRAASRASFVPATGTEAG